MPVDAAGRAYLDDLAASGAKPIYEMEPADARLQMVAGNISLPTPQDVMSITDETVGNVPVRIYRPADGVLPAIVFFHGGGWVVGDIETHDGHCRDLANKLGRVVVSVHYRLAPEAIYPAAAEDSYAVTNWLATNAGELQVDANRIAVMGDSAGGNLAAVVPLMARDCGGPNIEAQLLVYPITDFPTDTPSYEEYAEGFGLTQKAMQWFWDLYVPDASKRSEPYASPMRADLSNLPRALVLTAECDVLRDEGEEYAKKLQAAGIECQLIRYDGALHGYIRHPHRFQQAVDSVEAIKSFLG